MIFLDDVADRCGTHELLNWDASDRINKPLSQQRAYEHSVAQSLRSEMQMTEAQTHIQVTIASTEALKSSGASDYTLT